ncbi:PIN family toxin-antitoxin system, toxin component [Corynebacterium frankenforstense]|uniref:PIN-like domain-containing protein n=1 Tax=Corynebacterium frankenforstense TaxID=1230998 RepID=UPI0012EC8259|nr:PIN family toxin-antitoxin system, toxin component [Corynebacterium frankenforstense]
MKVVIDANEMPRLAQLLGNLFTDIEFVHVRDLGLMEASDQQLFEELNSRGFDLLITRDLNQLRNPDEMEGLRGSGLSWIGHKESKKNGLAGLREILATYSVALPHVQSVLRESGEAMYFKLRKLPAGASQLIQYARNFRDGEAFKLPR